ncbi:MAG: type II secretion system protein [Candidatus Sulfobium sp.]|jgi:prepilin-type N-terminal cleavage/methylation domain-containing protein
MIQEAKGIRGITLVELLIVISIISLLALAAGFSYEGWKGRYKQESEVRQVYTDLVNARTMAMQEDRAFFVKFPSSASYTIYRDTNPPVDGNGLLEDSGTNKDTTVTGYPKSVDYRLTWTGGGIITFESRGIIDPASGDIYITSSNNADTTKRPDYDCISLRDMKIDMGKWDISDGTCTVK